jgi:addiction module HigA family antidote
MPGDVIRWRILERMKIRQSDLARAMGVSTVRLNHIVNGKAPITPAMAIRLGHAVGEEPRYWLCLQAEYDLYRAGERLGDTLDKLPKPVRKGRAAE